MVAWSGCFRSRQIGHAKDTPGGIYFEMVPLSVLSRQREVIVDKFFFFFGAFAQLS